MIYYSSILVLCLGAMGAVFGKTSKQSAVSLWIAGLGLGAVFLFHGAELLAFAQWVLSTISASVLMLHGTMLGEDEPKSEKRFTRLLPSVFFLVFVSGLIFIVRDNLFFQEIGKIEESNTTMGKYLVEQYPLLLPMVAITLLLLIVGNGVISRLERTKE